MADRIASHMIKRFIAACVLLVLVASGCSSTTESEGAGSVSPSVSGVSETSPTTAPADGSLAPTTAPAPAQDVRGVTESEIRVGIGIIDASEFGFDGGDQEAQWQAAIDAVNEAGGVHGRMLVPTYASYSPVGATEADEACLRLTEDTEVFAFIGFVRESRELCYTESHDTIAINRETPTDDAIARSDGLLFSAGSTKLGQSLLAIDAAAADGLIDGQRIHINADPIDANLVAPVREALEAAGAEVTGDATTSSDPGDTPALEAEHDIIVERLVANDVGTIFAIGSIGLGSTGGVERSGADITVISTLANAATFLRFGYDPSAIDLRMYGPRTFEAMHADGANGVPECVDRYEAASGNTAMIGVVDPVPNNFLNIVWACRGVDLFAAMADAAGPNLSNDTFVSAANGLSSLTLTGTSAASLGPDKAGADDTPFVALRWDPDALNFVTG